MFGMVLTLLIALSVSGFILAERAWEIAERERIETVERLNREHDIHDALSKVEGLKARLGGSPEEDLTLLVQAKQLAKYAERLANSDLANVTLRPRIQTTVEGLKVLESESRLLHEVSDLRFLPYTDESIDTIRSRFNTLFGKVGIDIESSTPEQAAQNLRTRSLKVQKAITDLLFLWQSEDYFASSTKELSEISQKWWAVIEAIDRDPWRIEVRAALRSKPANLAAVLNLVGNVESAAQSPSYIASLSKNLDGLPYNRNRAYAEAHPDSWRKLKGETSLDLLRRCQLHHPNDCFIALALSDKFLSDSKDANVDRQFYRSEAIRFASIAVAISPQSPVLRHELARKLRWVDRQDEALEIYEQTTRLFPGAESFQELARELARRQQFPEAMTAYRRALELALGSERIPYEISRIYINSGKYEKALAEVQNATLVNQHSAFLNLELAICCRLCGDRVAALAALERAKELYLSGHGELSRAASSELTRELISAGAVKSGYEAFKRSYAEHRLLFGSDADDLNTEIRELFLPDNNTLLVNNKDFKEYGWWDRPEMLCSLFEYLIKENPRDAWNYVYLARYKRITEPEAAIKLCRHVLDAEPESAQSVWAQIEIARIQEKQGHDEEARVGYRRALEFPFKSKSPRELEACALARKIAALELKKLEEMVTQTN